MEGLLNILNGLQSNRQCAPDGQGQVHGQSQRQGQNQRQVHGQGQRQGSDQEMNDLYKLMFNNLGQSPKVNASSVNSSEEEQRLKLRLQQVEHELAMLKYDRISRRQSSSLNNGQVIIKFSDGSSTDLQSQGWKPYQGTELVYIVTAENLVYLYNPTSHKFEHLTMGDRAAQVAQPVQFSQSYAI